MKTLEQSKKERHFLKNGTYNVGIGKNVRSILSVENDAGKKVYVNINIVEKNSKIYNENKESIEKSFRDV